MYIRDRLWGKWWLTEWGSTNELGMRALWQVSEIRIFLPVFIFDSLNTAILKVLPPFRLFANLTTLKMPISIEYLITFYERIVVQHMWNTLNLLLFNIHMVNISIFKKYLLLNILCDATAQMIGNETSNKGYCVTTKLFFFDVTWILIVTFGYIFISGSDLNIRSLSLSKLF